MKEIRSMRYAEHKLYLIDQRILPNEFGEFCCDTWRDVAFAIKDMVVRGAPAIGAAVAFGMVLAAKEYKLSPIEEMKKLMINAAAELAATRPTAVNLVWALNRMKRKMIEAENSGNLFQLFEKEAIAIFNEDIEINKKIGEFGNTIIPEKATILTHCNTGALATVGWGTALGVIRSAVQSNKEIFVYADETRPRLQGARLTAWELLQEKIPHCLIADSVAATLIRDGKIDLILVGADRIAKNGDAANKIGTFMLSVLAQRYSIPFYVVAPTSTIDFAMQSGSEIVIEERSEDEVKKIDGIYIAPFGTQVYNPAFDVTPNEFITAIITEKGIIEKPFAKNIENLEKICL
jgi:methylthioribose-1-phosphate isomerase